MENNNSEMQVFFISKWNKLKLRVACHVCDVNVVPAQLVLS